MTDKIYTEDCLQTMKRMGDDAVDTVITSPPYNMGLKLQKGKYAKRNDNNHYTNKYQDSLSIDEYFEWQKTVITELLRVTKHYIFYNIQLITGNKPALMRLLGHFSEQVKDILIWDKKYAEPAWQGCLNSEFEFIIVFCKTAIKRKFEDANFGVGKLSNIIRVKKITKNQYSDNEHCATMPLDLVQILVENFTKKGDIIYDPFAGTGTTLRMAQRLGRKWIGSEIVGDFAKKAKRNVGLGNILGEYIGTIVERYADAVGQENVAKILAQMKKEGKKLPADAEIDKATIRSISMHKIAFGKLEAQIKERKYTDLINALHLGNKNWRKFFEEYTGLKLGKTLKETELTLRKFTGHVNPLLKIRAMAIEVELQLLPF